MILADIGNSTINIFKDETLSKYYLNDFNLDFVDERVYYISVNKDFESKLNSNWIDIKPYIDYSKYYDSFGVDRAVCCEYIDDGLIVDAGSAITVDIMDNGSFVGGYISLGLKTLEKSYKSISKALDYSFNFELDLGKMPKSSEDAISFGSLGILAKDVNSYEKKIYITGGDAHKIKKLFKNAQVVEDLVFLGMKRVLDVNSCTS